MRLVTVILFFCIYPGLGFCQNVGIGTTTPDNSAVLDLTSADKGLLVPRVADTTAIAAPTGGLVIFNQNMRTLNYHDGVNWRSFSSNNNLSNADSITVSISGSPEVRILSYTQESTRTLGTDGRPTSGVFAGTYSFSKKFDPIVSDILKNKTYAPLSTSTITIRMYTNGALFFSMTSTISYVYGSKDSYDPVNGYIETYYITAKQLVFMPSNASQDNNWP